MHGDLDELRMRGLLRGHPRGLQLASARFSPIAGGQLNRSWRADTDGGSYFVRLARGEARLLGADWHSEVALLDLASRAGLAPASVLADPAAGLLVTQFLDGRVLTHEQASEPVRLARVGRLLRELHALAPTPGIRKLDFAVQARYLERQLGSDKGVHAGLRDRAATVFARLEPARAIAVPCHNDVHCQNLIDDGRDLRLVDWEYGGIGDPVFDLAGYLSHHALDEPQAGILLDAYGAGSDRARLGAARWAYDYVQWLWFRVAARMTGVVDTGLEATAAAIADRLLVEDPG
jgi:aminoglycoside phosphotransferase (APT) family kinase protein